MSGVFMAHDIFLSYGREDASVMQQVEKTLREAGFTIWTDKGIAPGSPSWKAAIEQAILDARCVVVLFSPDSSESRWVRAELDYADSHRKPIYPLLVRGDATDAIPFGFTSYQWIDLRKSSQWTTGLLQLTAALRGESPALPTDTVPAARPGKRRLLLLAGVLFVVVIAVSLLLINRNAQTVVAALSTTGATVTQIVPTALPTMPPFTVPDGFKKLEGEHTLLAVPSNWSTDVDPAILREGLLNISGTNENAMDLVQRVMESLDSISVDMLRFQSAATAIEDMSVNLSYSILEARQKSVFLESFIPGGTFVSRGLIDLPAGTMLVTEGYDSNVYMLSYLLMRGSITYTVYFNGRLTDKETINRNAETIVQTFRIKE